MARASIRCSTCSTSTSTKRRRSTGSGRCTTAPGAATDPVALGRQIYDRTCAACHGAARQGTPPHTPALVDLKRTPQEIETIIAEGRNAMPAFRQFRAARAQRAGGVPEDAARRCRAERSRSADASGSLHDRRLSAVPRSARRAGDRAAVGHAERDRSRQGRHRVEGPARRVPGAGQEGHPQHRARSISAARSPPPGA